LRNILGDGRSSNSIVGGSTSTIGAAGREMGHERRSTVQNLVIININHRIANRVRLPGKGHVEQQTTILGETAVTENLLMRNTRPILRSTAKIPRITHGNARASINTVNILQGRGEDDTRGTDARRFEKRRVDLDENVEPVEQGHVGHVDSKVSNCVTGHEGPE